MTYRLQMAGEGRRLERELQNAMAVAWHAGTLQRASPFPSFAKFTGIKAPPVRKQTPDEVKSFFRGLRAQPAK